MDIAAALTALYQRLRREKKDRFRRSLSFGDLFTDRWERAAFEGFGEGTSVYDNVLILGNVRVGRNCWIGPNTILDGSGGLTIGDGCSISSGVQIYTHDTVRHAISLGEQDIERAPTEIGNGVYIGPNSVIQKGVIIGDQVIIGAMSLVNRSIPSGSKAWGVPARVVGRSQNTLDGADQDSVRNRSHPPGDP